MDAPLSWRRCGSADRSSRKSSPDLAFAFWECGVPDSKCDTAATIIPSVGCPLGCNFCTTSSFFGGKGKSIHFYETGDQLFDVMQQMETSLGVSSFFMMDENFLLNRPRAMQLLDRMKQAGKSWALYVFSSVNAIRKYTMEELVQLGVSWIWVGLESPNSSYAKLKNSDTRALAAELRQHGIKILGSTIVGLEHHTPENIHEEIDYAVSHGTDFHQFMLYTPVPGTPLHSQMQQEGRMLDDVDLADIHGQFKFNYKHAAISRDQSKEFLDWAFRHDFERNGPSLFRICETIFPGMEALSQSIPTCACGVVSPRKPGSCAPLTMPRCGRWRSGFARRIRRYRESGFASCGARSKAPLECSLAWCAPWSARYCYGHRSAKTGGWPMA